MQKQKTNEISYDNMIEIKNFVYFKLSLIIIVF